MSVNTLKTFGPFRIVKKPSIYTNRNGKCDIVIYRETGQNWGAVYDGKHYTIATILDADTLRPIRSYLTVAGDVLDNLKAWGF
ncbi:hypothetical protein [Methylobacter sp. BlB1]|uniref:hypothetical protein n=1 Tax=Methylobacter sp. BlB1 TaxID=2785914 RepID=UPI001894D59C|nr:hypothetical protein [Methylobacter sp. BlB1]MBF6650022.1 hypothetical protein [Methylobacter sp. BlB1]